jgi:segregation and condensation protein A
MATTAPDAASPDAIDSTLYEVKLEVFEGPLDLLLYLIRKDELDIYDIPIAHITSEYRVFLQDLHRLDVEQASDFILMAATLMKVKSQMLLPREASAGEGDGVEDPREELVRRLLEYQQYKEIADWLGLQKKAQSDRYLRRQGPGELGQEGTELRPVSLFALLKVYKHVLDTVPLKLVHEIVDEQASVEHCIEYVIAVLDQRSRVRFVDLVEGRDRITMIATFIGLLELLKSHRIKIQQARPFEDIWIEQRPLDQTAVVSGTAPTAAPETADGEAMA